MLATLLYYPFHNFPHYKLFRYLSEKELSQVNLLLFQRHLIFCERTIQFFL